MVYNSATGGQPFLARASLVCRYENQGGCRCGLCWEMKGGCIAFGNFIFSRMSILSISELWFSWPYNSCFHVMKVIMWWCLHRILAVHPGVPCNCLSAYIRSSKNLIVFMHPGGPRLPVSFQWHLLNIIPQVVHHWLKDMEEFLHFYWIWDNCFSQFQILRFYPPSPTILASWIFIAHTAFDPHSYVI